MTYDMKFKKSIFIASLKGNGFRNRSHISILRLFAIVSTYLPESPIEEQSNKM